MKTLPKPEAYALAEVLRTTGQTMRTLAIGFECLSEQFRLLAVDFEATQKTMREHQEIRDD